MNDAQQAALGVGAEKAFENYLEMGELRVQRCTKCFRYQFYPRRFCVDCGGQKLEWERVSGYGFVYSSSVVRRRESNGGDYNISIIELDEGCRMMSQVVDISPEQVEIGMKVKCIVERHEGPMRVCFRPARTNKSVRVGEYDR